MTEEIEKEEEVLKRTADEVLHFIAEQQLRFIWVRPMIPEAKESTLGQDTLIIIDKTISSYSLAVTSLIQSSASTYYAKVWSSLWIKRSYK